MGMKPVCLQGPGVAQQLGASALVNAGLRWEAGSRGHG